ncbi:MAG: hypothetical protein ACOC1E_04600, partial [Marinilabiliaceae bacterium]
FCPDYGIDRIFNDIRMSVCIKGEGICTDRKHKKWARIPRVFRDRRQLFFAIAPKDKRPGKKAGGGY